MMMMMSINIIIIAMKYNQMGILGLQNLHPYETSSSGLSSHDVEKGQVFFHKELFLPAAVSPTGTNKASQSRMIAIIYQERGGLLLIPGNISNQCENLLVRFHLTSMNISRSPSFFCLWFPMEIVLSGNGDWRAL